MTEITRELKRTQAGRVDLAELAHDVCDLEGGVVNLPIAQVAEVLACLGVILAEAGLVPAAEVMCRLMERGARRVDPAKDREARAIEINCGLRGPLTDTEILQESFSVRFGNVRAQARGDSGDFPGREYAGAPGWENDGNG